MTTLELNAMKADIVESIKATDDVQVLRKIKDFLRGLRASRATTLEWPAFGPQTVEEMEASLQQAETEAESGDVLSNEEVKRHTMQLFY